MQVETKINTDIRRAIVIEWHEQTYKNRKMHQKVAIVLHRKKKLFAKLKFRTRKNSLNLARFFKLSKKIGKICQM